MDSVGLQFELSQLEDMEVDLSTRRVLSLTAEVPHALQVSHTTSAHLSPLFLLKNLGLI